MAGKKIPYQLTKEPTALLYLHDNAVPRIWTQKPRVRGGLDLKASVRPTKERSFRHKIYSRNENSVFDYSVKPVKPQWNVNIRNPQDSSVPLKLGK